MKKWYTQPHPYMYVNTTKLIVATLVSYYTANNGSLGIF